MAEISIPEWQLMEIIGTEHEAVFELTDHQEVRRYLDDHGLHYHVISEDETDAQRLRRLFGGR